MKEERFWELENAVDAELLEDAQRKHKNRGSSLWAWGTLAACACIAVLCWFGQTPRQAAPEMSAAGIEKIAVVTEEAAAVEDRSAKNTGLYFHRPEDAEDYEEYTMAEPGVQYVQFTRNGVRIICGVLDAEGRTLEEILQNNPMQTKCEYAIICDGKVLSDPAKMTFDENGGGQIFWLDAGSDAFFGITVDTGASEQGLQTLAETLWSPALG